MNNNLAKDVVDLAELRGKLMRYVAGKVRLHDDVEDIVQETLTRMEQYVDWTSIESPIAYALQVSKSIIAKNYQTNAKLKLVEDSNLVIAQLLAVDDQEQRLIEQQKLRAIAAVLDKMPQLRRDVFVRRKLDGKSREQISEEFDLSLDAVKKHINRATVDLTLALQKQGLLEG